MRVVPSGLRPFDGTGLFAFIVRRVFVVDLPEPRPPGEVYGEIGTVGEQIVAVKQVQVLFVGADEHRPEVAA